MGVSDNWPDQNSLLTESLRDYLMKSDEEIEAMNKDTVYTNRSRLKSRIQAGMWDFGVLFSQMDIDQLRKLYSGPEPEPQHETNHKRMPLEGFSDHAANAIAFLYLALPFPAFMRALETGIYRAETEKLGHRMVGVDAEVDRTYAPTEENEEAYDPNVLRDKLQKGEELSDSERAALANMVEFYEDSRQVREDEKRYAARGSE